MIFVLLDSFFGRLENVEINAHYEEIVYGKTLQCVD